MEAAHFADVGDMLIERWMTVKCHIKNLDLDGHRNDATADINRLQRSKISLTLASAEEHCIKLIKIPSQAVLAKTDMKSR